MEKLSQQADDPLIGCTLPGGHTVIELIDVGGMGRVYRAEQKMLGRTVAVKIIHPHLLGDDTVEARFITEARAASQLNHPNSVGVIDFGKFEGRLYMVMEYLRGRDLATVAHEDGPLEIDRVVDVVIQTLAALEEAHHVGIIHRDLKPENIVLAPLRSGGDFVKVLDFGLAKVLQAAQSKRITDPGMVCGTPEYMAPEQARGDNIDHRADLYACGVLLFELLAGQLPFEGATPRETVLQHLSKMPPDLDTLVPERKIPKALSNAVSKALSKNPADRFQRAADFSRTLKKVLAARQRVGAITLAKCPSCGAMMPQRQKFCGECGSSMTRQRTLAHTSPPPKPPSIVPEAPSVRISLEFVGREDELEQLGSLRESAESKLVAVSLVGAPGNGKTRLMDEFLRQAKSWGDAVALTRPDPWWCEKGYHALRQAVASLAGLPEDGGSPSDWAGASPEVRAGLNALFERTKRDSARTLRRRWAATPPTSVDDPRAGRRELVAEALRWAVSRAHGPAGDRRVVLAVDDFHALDGASKNALADLAAEPPLVPVLLIAAHSPGLGPNWEDAHSLEVHGLPTKVAVRLMDADGAPRDGNGAPKENSRVAPMYVEQLMRFTRESGEDPPPKLADLIALRIERMPAEARRVLQGVAVLGDVARSAQLVAMLPDVRELSRHLRDLEDAGLIAVDSGVVSSTHPLIRDVTLASTPAAVKSALHGKARGDFGVDGVKTPLEADTLHAYFAGQSFEALMLLERSADAAREREDLDGVIAALHRALELARREMVRGELDDPVNAMLMFSVKLGDALAEAGKGHDAEGVLTEALNLAGPSSVERSRILASLANVARGGGRADAAYQHLDEAVRIAEKADPELLEALERTRQRWFQGL